MSKKLTVLSVSMAILSVFLSVGHALAQEPQLIFERTNIDQRGTWDTWLIDMTAGDRIRISADVTGTNYQFYILAYDVYLKFLELESLTGGMILAQHFYEGTSDFSVDFEATWSGTYVLLFRSPEFYRELKVELVEAGSDIPSTAELESVQQTINDFSSEVNNIRNETSVITNNVNLSLGFSLVSLTAALFSLGMEMRRRRN